MVEFIKLKGITKGFGNNLVLDKLNMTINETGITCIIGISGSGKTTLLNIIAGFIKPQEGELLYNGINITSNKKVIKNLFGFATQDGSIYPKLTVEENLFYFGAMYNLPRRLIQSKIEELLKKLELSPFREVIAENLSTGMFRRLDIACSLIHEPKILILDEPTGNLDPILRKKILTMIKKISDNGTKVIFTSHLINEAEKICDELAILHKGKIIEFTHPDLLKQKYCNNDLISIQTASGEYSEIIESAKKLGVKSIIRKDDGLFIYSKNSDLILQQLINTTKKENIVNTTITRPSMEEIFEMLTKE